ncbi:choice-of-anchor B family protein [Aquipuribacter nitratireducens]|uniref:Choice-of-anchor B family protein n=1 Tax=Aquipuribacter nitratireducens TaxID=650104 RepID=A0ABW0GSK5_9MICO
MRKRIAAVAATVGMFAAVAMSPAQAHHPEITDVPGETTSVYKYEGLVTKLDRDWSTTSTSGSKGAAKGNAPGTSAPCINGMAADFFPCDGIDLLSHVSHNELGTTFVNDIWGWTDPQSKKDYALVGATNGTVFVDISDAKRPQVLGILPTASTAGGSTWRDIKVYENHAFVVSEHTNHGIQVFDLTRLRDWDGTYTTYDVDARYTGHGSAHNININEETGFAYSVGAGPFSSQPLPYTVTVDPPSAAAGSYLANGAVFGPAPTQAGFSGAFALGVDGGGSTLGCTPLVGFPAGAIAIVDRGTCAFTIKVKNAQDAGAVGVVVANNGAGTILMGGADPTITIPAVMVSQADGATIKAGLPATGSVVANDPPAVCGTGLHMVDVSEPTSPTYAGCFDDHGYIHDTQCVVYDGPDTDYTGREICFNSNATSSGAGGLHRVAIVDVTDKANPVSIAREGYENDGYSHQGWLTPDKRFFLHGDELDEQRRGINTTTRVWDVSDLDYIVEIQAFANDTTSIDHNIYTQGRYAYASNYTSGLRVYDTRDLAGGGLSEAAFFDVYPENDNTTFEGGTWSNYAYLGQKGVVAVSSIDRGLFILQPRLSRQGN